jgi:hypothetical protein
MGGGCATWTRAAPKQNTPAYVSHTAGQKKDTITKSKETHSQASKAKGKKCPINIPEEKTKSSQQQGLCVFLIGQ